MTIDKSWTTLTNHFGKEYMVGLNAFMERCKNYVNTYNNDRCPCNDCGNVNWLPIPRIKQHIHTYGFCKTYKTWTFHGEPVVPPPVVHVKPQTTDPMHDFITDVRQENVPHEHNTNSDEPMNTTQPSSLGTAPQPQQTDQSMFSRAEVEGMIAARLAQDKEAWQSQMMTNMMLQVQSQISSQVKKAMKQNLRDEETDESSDEE